MADDQEPPATAGVQESSVSTWEQMRERFAGDDELREDESPILTALLAAGIDPRDRLARSLDAATWCKRRATEALMLKAHFTNRERRYEERFNWLSAQIKQLLEALEMTRFHTPQASATLQPGPQSLVVTDETKVPEEYWRTTRTLLRQELKDDIRKHGVQVDGAHLSNGAPMLVVRRK